MVKISFETITSQHALAGYAITCITAIEIVALTQGINGTLLAVVTAFVAGLGGYYGRKKQEAP